MHGPSRFCKQVLFGAPKVVWVAGLLLVAGCHVAVLKIEVPDSISTLQTTGDVVIRGGVVEKMAPGSEIRLSEKRFGKTRTAKILERKGEPEFFVQSGGAFHQADVSERRWIKSFLASMRPEDKPEPVLAAIESRMANPEDIDFLVPLRRLRFESEQVSALKTLAISRVLNSRQQIVLIQSCFEVLSFSSDRVSVLESLVRHQRLSREARLALLDRVDSLSFHSDRRVVLKALAATK